MPVMVLAGSIPATGKILGLRPKRRKEDII